MEDPSETPARQRAGAAGVAPSQLEAGPETVRLIPFCSLTCVKQVF